MPEFISNYIKKYSLVSIQGDAKLDWILDLTMCCKSATYNVKN